MSGSQQHVASASSKEKRKKGWKQVVYKRKKIKMARVKGEKYENYRGNIVEARTQGKPCGCKSQCFTKVPEDVRNELFKNFYNLETKNEQDSYLQGLIDYRPISRRRPRVDANKARPKMYTFKYNIVTKEEKINVCKAAFLSLHCISSDRVRRVSDLLLLGKIPEDKRGRKSPEKEVVVLIP
ncbi:unnamed protein product [Brassicogethes aeneus]|uniref:Uncharacterized protein n=1 Tax=Brassicogethes aeneus TaxID=1431903 RepID=A0A9P0BIZ0_BRAAE|nr:unnamed protein product [Brassicogethes aeneus]